MRTFFFESRMGEILKGSDLMLFGYEVSDEKFKVLELAERKGIKLKDITPPELYDEIVDAAVEEWKQWLPHEGASENLKEAIVRDSLIYVDFVSDTMLSDIFVRGENL